MSELIKNYLKLIRFDKPIGSLLLLWPTLWGIWVASSGKPNLWILIVFIAGVFLMRSAGCIINDLADRNYDGHVARTKNRVLVNSTSLTIGTISIKQAIGLFSVLVLIAFLLTLSLFNTKLIIHSCIALLLACIYPLCKRFFACPQFVLGLAFGYAIPMAFVAINGNGQIDNIAWLLYSASIILTIVYDSFYAMVDRQDDLKLGLKSSVIWFGKYDLVIIAILQGLFLINIFFIYYYLEFDYYFYILIILLLLLFVYQLKLAKTGQPELCLKAFKNNSWVGLILFLGFFLEYL